ncbi:hypothetical protein ACN20G_03220 [Streptomyces sp. BI20]
MIFPKVCRRCDRAIREDEPHDTFHPESMSGVKASVHTHRGPCPKPAEDR